MLERFRKAFEEMARYGLEAERLSQVPGVEPITFQVPCVEAAPQLDHHEQRTAFARTVASDAARPHAPAHDNDGQPHMQDKQYQSRQTEERHIEKLGNQSESQRLRSVADEKLRHENGQIDETIRIAQGKLDPGTGNVSASVRKKLEDQIGMLINQKKDIAHTQAAVDIKPEVTRNDIAGIQAEQESRGRERSQADFDVGRLEGRQKKSRELYQSLQEPQRNVDSIMRMQEQSRPRGHGRGGR